ncbi:acetylglutamate kinase [Pseudolysobacter antarcticus]|uniref:Acetylglutamate kinase n=1 Tax=Pseudolysobacter antarcticus TaxID=2511995 RepID=A0A411HIP0_9GAMM|nr:acetylglutamate kinase [Pseudolysobacter antarcticus]QBB70260.1 acetylglutamate kinase [Pseudolysobacter antarcticus]
MDAHKNTRSTIVRLLSSMASAKEIQQYLKRFSQLDASRFAVVKVGGAVLKDDLENLTSSLAFLQQVGLTPIVIHGAGPQLNEELADAGIKTPIVDGLRVTSPEALAVVRRVFQQENLKLVEALQQTGSRATSVISGVFEADFLNRRKFGLVGKVTRVNLAPIEASLKASSIPVIASLGETPGGQILNINADFAANELVVKLKPYKIIFLSGTGGLLDGEQNVIDSINLSTEYEALMQQPWLHSGMRLKIEQIHDLLDKLPLSSSVSITKPEELAKELFTHRGSGTLLRRGEKIRRVTRWKQLDLDKLKHLIESGFRRKLLPDYFKRTELHRAYVSEKYRAALLLTVENGIAHLDKFAVADDAQGEGLGRAAWQVMRDENPRLFWRARADNPVNEFYFEEADGCIKGEKWNVFWYGLTDFTEIAWCVEHCRTRPATLKG